MRAKDLIKPLLEFSSEELKSHISHLRYLRTIQETTTKATKRKKETQSAAKKLDALLAGMTPEQRAEFMAKHLG